MNPPKDRIIYSRASARKVPDLLQMIFAAELLCPSRCLWIVSPWISDIPVIDNRTNGFLSFEPEWARSQVRLSQVLGRLLRVGTTVYIATRPVEHNETFLARIRREAEPDNLPLVIKTAEELHEKGILGDSFYLSGSMNFTHSGISLNEEAIHYTADSVVVAENRVRFTERWGGPQR
jgi:phosphatidylserine/phosphatidylglycerophosphate/cardiolipin synthase-like enzyme